MLPFTLELSALLPAIVPPVPLFGDPPTGVSTVGCYLAAAGDCEGKLSREHIVSHGVLRQLAEVWVHGLRWRPGDAWTPLRPETMVARILCRRHNELIGALDAPAALAFAAVRDPTDFVANGHVLERWFGKVVVGAIVAHWHGSRGPTENDLAPWVPAWLLGRDWPPDDLALHVVHERGLGDRGSALVFPRPDSTLVSIGVCLGDAGHEVGAAFWLGGIPFFLSIAPEQEWRRFVPFRTTRRPASIRLSKGGSSATLTLDWSPLRAGDAVNAVAR